MMVPFTMMDLLRVTDLLRIADLLRITDLLRPPIITAFGSGACSVYPIDRTEQAKSCRRRRLKPTPTCPVPRGPDNVFQIALLGAPVQYFSGQIHRCD